MESTMTARGFDLIVFSDRYGVDCSLQKSSLATDDAIWLGVEDADPRILASDMRALGKMPERDCGWVPYPIPKQVMLTTRMHLTRDQVAELLPYLQRFVSTGELTRQEPRHD